MTPVDMVELLKVIGLLAGFVVLVWLFLGYLSKKDQEFLDYLSKRDKDMTVLFEVTKADIRSMVNDYKENSRETRETIAKLVEKLERK